MIKVPLRFCSLILTENLENTASVFLALKFLFIEGNFFLDENVFHKIKTMCGIKSEKTIKKHFEILVQLNWIWINQFNNLVNIKSLLKILNEKNINDFYYFKIYPNQLKNLNGYLGAALFTYCSYKFWRSQIMSGRSNIKIGNISYSIFKRGGRRVIISDVNKKAISSLSLSKLLTPIALVGVSKIFRLSKSKVNRLKLEAIKQRLLHVKSSFKKIDIPIRELNFAKAEKVLDYALVFNKELYQRDVDLIKSELIMYKIRGWKKSKQ